MKSFEPGKMAIALNIYGAAEYTKKGFIHGFIIMMSALGDFVALYMPLATCSLLSTCIHILKA